jgi:hypothetical protein
VTDIDALLDLMQSRGLMADERDALAVYLRVLDFLEEPTKQMLEAGRVAYFEHPENHDYVRDLYSPQQDIRHAATLRLVTGGLKAMLSAKRDEISEEPEHLTLRETVDELRAVTRRIGGLKFEDER